MNDLDRPGLATWLRRNWMRVYFVVALVLVAFGAGLVAAIYETRPYHLMKEARAAVIDLRHNGLQYARLEPTQHLFPAHADTRGVVQHDPARTMPGVTLIAGMFEDKQTGFRLLSPTGDVLHTWHVSFNEIWPNPTHIPESHHDWDVVLHGVHLFANGDIAFNFEYEGLVRIDRDSNVVWKLPRRTHHAIFEDEQGGLWVPDVREHKAAQADFPGMNPPFYEDLVIRVDPSSGNVTEEISLTRAFYQSRLEGLLFLGGHAPGNTTFDHLHINDVEILPSTLADAFPQFAAGDIMVSARNPDLLMILDRDTHTVKWWRVGPWLRQHDPDFSPDGKIVLFDNRRDQLHTARFGGSRIVTIDPQTYATEVLFEGKGFEDFYTSRLGKLQLLENGNLLLTEAEAGRAVEITRQGEIVWEFVNRWDDQRVALISDAQRFDPSKLTFLSKEIT